MIKQIMYPSGTRPYVTIVDTGLATAAQNALALLAISVGQGRAVLDLDGDEFLPDVEDIEEIANALAKELQKRTF